MNIEEYIDSKVTTMTDLSGKKSKVLLLKNETEIESFKKQLALCNVSQCNEQLMAILTSRVLTIQSEPDGIVRETMIDNLLIDINCG